MDPISLLLLEKDQFDHVDAVWMNAQVTQTDQEALCNEAASRDMPAVEKGEFYIIKREGVFYYNYRVGVDQLKTQMAVNEAILVIVSKTAQPKKAEAMARELLNGYIGSKGNPTKMLEMYLKALASGKVGNVDIKSIVE